MKKIAALLALLAIFAYGCEEIPLPTVFPQMPVFTLGVLSDRTDRRASPEEPEPEGLAFYYGVQAAVNEAVVTYRGHLQIKLLEADIEGDLASAKPLCKKLIREGADAIICPASIVSKISYTASNGNVLVMAPDYDDRLVSLPKEDDEDQVPNSQVRKNDFLYSIMPSGEEYGRIAAFYAQLQSWNSAVMLYDNTNLFWTDAAESFRISYEASGRKLLDSRGNACSNSSILRDLTETLCSKNKKANCLFIGCDPDMALNAVLPGMHRTAFSGGTFFYSGAKDCEDYIHEDFNFWYAKGQNCLSVFAGVEKKGVLADFYEKYERLYGERATFAAAVAYDGAGVLLAAADRAGGGSYNALQKAMSGLRYTGVTGQLYYADTVGYPLRSLYSITLNTNEDYSALVQRVKYTLVCPEDALTASEAPEPTSDGTSGHGSEGERTAERTDGR